MNQFHKCLLFLSGTCSISLKCQIQAKHNNYERSIFMKPLGPINSALTRKTRNPAKLHFHIFRINDKYQTTKPDDLPI